MPCSSPTAWCEIVGPRAAREQARRSAATRASSALEFPPSTARMAAFAAWSTPSRDGGVADRRTAARTARVELELVDPDERRRRRRAAARRSRAAPPRPAPARCAAARRGSSPGPGRPSTTVASTTLADRRRAPSRPAATDQPTCTVARAGDRPEHPRVARAGAEGACGTRASDRRPVVARIVSSATAMSERKAARAEERHAGVVVRVVADEVPAVGDSSRRCPGTPRPSGPGRRTVARSVEARGAAPSRRSLRMLAARERGASRDARRRTSSATLEIATRGRLLRLTSRRR